MGFDGNAGSDRRLPCARPPGRRIGPEEHHRFNVIGVSPMEITYFLSFNRLVSKSFYRLQTHMFGTDDVVFLNIGYEENPPMALPLMDSDEPNRFYIQLYH